VIMTRSVLVSSESGSILRRIEAGRQVNVSLVQLRDRPLARDRNLMNSTKGGVANLGEVRDQSGSPETRSKADS
jgi:hypothetical protein